MATLIVIILPTHTHPGYANTYRSPGHDLAKTNGTHTFMSFYWTKKTGAYMTMYLSPKIFDVHLPEYAKTQTVDNVWAGFAKAWELMK